MYTTKKVSVPWHVLSYLTVCIRVHYDNDMSLYITASINTSIYIHDIIPWSLKSIKAFTWLEMLWKDFFFTESQSSKIWKTKNYLGIMFRSSSHKKRFFVMCRKRGHATANLIIIFSRKLLFRFCSWKIISSTNFSIIIIIIIIISIINNNKIKSFKN